MTSFQSARRMLALVALSFVGGTAVSQQISPPRVPLFIDQWRSVQSNYPLIATAYLQSLVALAEEDPQEAALAREKAFMLARQCGLATVPHPECGLCDLPSSEGDSGRTVECLKKRLGCLRSR